MQRVDIVVIGGGPAGLAASIEAARLGLGVVVLERSRETPDKACGEGLMPRGVAALRRLGALELVDPQECAEFKGIRYLQEQTFVEGCFSNGSGLGIRRTALVKALEARAVSLGVELKRGVRARLRECTHERVVVEAEQHYSAGLLIAADGLNSRIRREAGLELPVDKPYRYGVRRHYALDCWTPFVEVYWADGAEAYVTPAGKGQVGVAVLWHSDLVENASYDRLLERFPSLVSKLEAAPAVTEARGAGPLLRRARSTVGQRLVLLGDAAGYLDAITGEGLTLAFHSAAALGKRLPGLLKQDPKALKGYEADYRALYGAYARPARLLLELSRRPRLRSRLLCWVSGRPKLFAYALNLLL